MGRIERQEIYCHNCGNYVRFDLDMELNGNHVLRCPRCRHEHCRVVRDGKITDTRWGQRNGLPTFQVYAYSTSSSSATSSSNGWYTSTGYSGTSSGNL